MVERTIAAMRQITKLTEGLSAAANEDEILVNPIFISHLKIPNVVMVPIADTEATWSVFVAWQRGKTTGPLRALLDALPLKSGAKSPAEKASEPQREGVRAKAFGYAQKCVIERETRRAAKL